MTNSPRYDLRYATHAGRCAWCWEALPKTDSHAIVSAQAAPSLELHFHHACWREYRALSGIEGAESRAAYREWNPPRVEALRLHAGLTLVQLAELLKISKDRLVGYLAGSVPFGQKPLGRLRVLAVDTRFERSPGIDWSDRRACFSLCMKLGWDCGTLGRKLGVKDNTVSAWWDKGVPKISVRHWARLQALARRYRFHASDVIPDRLWTPDLVRDALAESGQTQAAWGAAAGCDWSLIRDAVQGRRRVNRRAAYFLTCAAVKLGVPLPPEGYIEPKRRAKRPFPHHEREGELTGRPLADLCRQKGLSLGEMAKKVGISFSALSKMARGKTRPRRKTARRLAEVLGVGVEVFIPPQGEG